MAFMMPVMKKNYALYGKQQRKNASETDSGGGGGGGRKISQPQNSSAHPHRRRVKSEGPSLSTSPSVMTGAEQMAQRTKPIGMRRGRGSAPALAGLAPSIGTSISLHPNTAPGTSPAPISVVSSPSRSTSSSSTSSGSTAALGRFHTKLVARLRRSLRLKDPEPTPT